MAHLKKGSPEAKAWAVKMKKARIRTAGRRTEKQFFGSGGEMQRSFYAGLQKERREHPEKFIAGIPRTHRKNPKGDYSGVLKLPFYIERAVAMVLRDGSSMLDWEWDRRMSPENKKHFHDFLVSVHHPLAYEAGTPEQRFKRFILEYVMPRIEKNPGAAWHTSMAEAASGYGTRSRESLEKAMFKGIEVAHRDSATAARRLQMNRTKERVIRPRHRKNPLAVFGVGNPPKSIRANIEGLIYSRCLEIRAEKTNFKPGFYRHPFSRKSGVQILALDTGDLLVHSTRGVNLWEPV